MSCALELLGLHQHRVPQKSFPAKAWCLEQTWTHCPFSPWYCHDIDIYKCTFAQTLHSYFLLCSPNTLTILILSIRGNQWAFNCQLCIDLKGLFRHGNSSPDSTTHAEWAGNWAKAALHHQFPLGMVTQAQTLLSERRGAGGAALPLWRDESTGEALTEPTVSQVHYWKWNGQTGISGRCPARFLEL